MTWPTRGAGISADDIASVQEAQAEMMPEWVFISDRVVTGGIATYEERDVPIIGRVGRVTVQIAAAFPGQVRDQAVTSVLTVPLGSPLAVTNRVRCLGRSFPVIGDLSQTSSYATASRYLLGPGVLVDDNGDPVDPTVSGRYYDSIVRLRASVTGTSSWSGDPIYNWASPAASDPVSAEVLPNSTAVELIDNQQAVINRFSVECEPADIISTDRVQWVGAVWYIDGEVAPFYSQGALHHLAFIIRRLSNA